MFVQLCDDALSSLSKRGFDYNDFFKRDLVLKAIEFSPHLKEHIAEICHTQLEIFASYWTGRGWKILKSTVKGVNHTVTASEMKRSTCIKLYKMEIHKYKCLNFVLEYSTSTTALQSYSADLLWKDVSVHVCLKHIWYVHLISAVTLTSYQMSGFPQRALNWNDNFIVDFGKKL